MFGLVQLKTGICEKRNGRSVECTEKAMERQAPFCVCMREREREGGGAGASGLKTNASTTFRIQGGEGCAMVLDLVMG